MRLFMLSEARLERCGTWAALQASGSDEANVGPFTSYERRIKQRAGCAARQHNDKWTQSWCQRVSDPVGLGGLYRPTYLNSCDETGGEWMRVCEETN